MLNLKDKGLLREAGLINSEWAPAQSGQTVSVIDPATQTAIGTVPDMGGQETRAAIAAAEAAFRTWKAKTNAERASVLETWFDLMIETLEDLALILTCEQGKPLDEARGKNRGRANRRQGKADRERRSNRPTRSAMAPPSSNGSPRKPGASMAIRSRRRRATGASWC